NEKLFSLPPLCEQIRIVTKVEELMSLCDQLEQHSLTSLDTHQQLVETLLTTLTDSQNADQLAENWSRISEHFDTLFTTEASIDALKQTILQLAVMGKLVPQDPNDEPASELLKRIAQEKAQLVKDGKMKKQKPLPPISDEEKPFELPDGWEWVKLGNILHDIKYGTSQKCD
ncbi:TPA: restriction endonuclease subunit S, partial [Salmonella enterica]|nr:restriction endonuclease subunit S [Salmonella enterica]